MKQTTAMNQKPIGTRIAELRKEKGLTQSEVVEKCNANIRTLQRIESNQVHPRMYTVRALLKAMEYDLDVLNEPNESNLSSSLKQKVTNFFDQAGLMFNQNKSIMKKVMFSLLFGAIAVFIISMGMTTKNKYHEPDYLIGTWQLVKIGSTEISTNDAFTRYMKFDGNLFVSFNKKGSLYNGGKYLADDDGNIVTIHAYNGKLCNNSNYYTYEINKDTMTFKGMFLRPTGNNSYHSSSIDEVWVKVEDIKLNNKKSPIADLIIY